MSKQDFSVRLPSICRSLSDNAHTRLFSKVHAVSQNEKLRLNLPPPLRGGRRLSVSLHKTVRGGGVSRAASTCLRSAGGRSKLLGIVLRLSLLHTCLSNCKQFEESFVLASQRGDLSCRSPLLKKVSTGHLFQFTPVERRWLCRSFAPNETLSRALVGALPQHPTSL